MKRLLIIQPGRSGDIIICLPIAKWYSKDYEVEWLCPKEYHSIFRNINYCSPVEFSSGGYDKVIDLSFGITPGTELHAWWVNTRPLWQSFIIPKYIIAEVPLRERWNLIWERDPEREDDLFSKLIADERFSYNLVQDQTHDLQVDLDVPNKIVFHPIDDFNIFDWYKMIQNANSIHCIDSLLCNFIEVVPAFLTKLKFYYQTKKTPEICDRTLLINNWRFL